ncbi:MAG: hypothetical protein AB7O62_05475 [Pirellulales bacterium]
MPDLLHASATWLADQLKTHAAREVVYQRGNQSVVVKATIGKTAYELLDANNVVTTYESRDYLIRAEDLVLGGTTLPEPGDEVLEDSQTFVVLPLPNEEHFRFADPYRVLLRIHTKANS